MSNYNTVADAIKICGPFMQGGSCNEDTALSYLTEACDRLMKKADWKHTLQLVRIRTNRAIFPLPREVETIRAVCIDGSPRMVFDQAYEFIGNGPGEVFHPDASSIRDIQYLGSFPTMYDMPDYESFYSNETNCTNRILNDGYKIIAFSTSSEDIKNFRSLTIYGNSVYHNQIDTSALDTFMDSGETVAINQWADNIEGVIGPKLSQLQMTTKKFISVSLLEKPITKGYVTVYAVDPDNKYLWLLAKIHPLDIRPMWERYRIINQALDRSFSANILALCKLKVLKLVDTSDICPIQNLYALKHMVQAITAENLHQADIASYHEATAIRILNEEALNHGDRNIRIIEDLMTRARNVPHIIP